MTNPVASDITTILSSRGGFIDLRTHVSDDDPFSSLTISILNEPNQGLTGVTGSNLIYRPDANASGTDVLTYQATDTDGNTDTGTITITINRAPTANTERIVVRSSESAVIRPLENDTDDEGDTLVLITVFQLPVKDLSGLLEIMSYPIRRFRAKVAVMLSLITLPMGRVLFMASVLLPSRMRIRLIQRQLRWVT